MTVETSPSGAAALGGTEKAITLALSLAQAEKAIHAFSAGQVDAIMDTDGRAYLLRPAQEHLRESERQLQAVIESAADAIMLVDRGGLINFQSRAGRRVLGYGSDELRGSRFFDRIHEADVRAVFSAFFNVIEEFLENATVHFRHRDPDGAYREIEATVGKLRDGSSVSVVFGMRAMSNRPRVREIFDSPAFDSIVDPVRDRSDHPTEAAVLESEERYHALFEAVPVAVFVCDRAAIIQQYNRQAAELWGREPECGVDSCCGAMRAFRPDGSPILHEQSYILEVLRTGKPALNVEVSLERPDGSRLPVLVNFAPLKNASGEITGAVSSFVDITERTQSEEAVRVAMVEIERASSAKDDFLAALSHELRTPLTPVLMTAKALESDPALPPEVREQLAMICRNIELEARLIDDLLDLTRISRGKLQIAPVAADLHQLLNHTAEIVRSDELGKQVGVVFELEAERHYALADPARLQQVFWNLIKNALKFTPTGGTITVSTRNDDEGWILVSVEDTGIGIGGDALPLIFKAFEQGDVAGQHRYGGLGLGLAISRAIVEVHGGTIVAESEGTGCGAKFTVALATVDAPYPSALASTPRSGSNRALRLLVVEDHEATRTVLTRLLARHGHHVTAAVTASEALTAFSAGHFDVVISDLGLPDGSGLEMMVKIQRLRRVPAIALSGYGMEEDLRQTKEAGFFAHLVKPVNLDQLRLLLDQLPARQSER